MSDPASAISGIGSLAGAMGGGGGGGGGGGTVVGGPSPVAAITAGMYQAQAARDAANTAKSAVNDAILSINKNYSQARYDVQPYRQEGVQALNQLNQYLGLDAYNPGAAPNAPKEFSRESILQNLSSKQLRNYIKDNSEVSISSSKSGVQAPHWAYTGEGAADPKLQSLYQAGFKRAGDKGYGGGEDANVLVSDVYAGNGMDAATAFLHGGRADYGNFQDFARRGAANEIYDEGIDAHNQEMEEYNRNKAEWQQNLDWYNQYTAEGPKTQQQITDEISAQPGFQAELNQGVEAIGKSGAARGYVGSGRILKELSNFGQNTLSKYYNNTLDRLGALAGMGQQAASQSGQIAMNQGQSVGQAKIGLGDTLANAKLAAGNATAQGILAANQEYKVIGGSKGGGGMK